MTFRLPRVSMVFLGLLVFAAISVRVLPPKVSSDSASYIVAVTVLDGFPPPNGFVPNRLLTTYGGLQIIRAIAAMGVKPFAGWIFMNIWFFAVGLSAFYLFVRELLGSEREAILGAILLGTSYPAIAFGLNFLMDMGGWAAYLVALYFSYRYFCEGRRMDALLGALAIGVGVLLKEYAALAVIPLGAALLVRLYRRERGVWQTTCLAAGIAALPLLLLYGHLYRVYGYTYLDWLSFNQGHYGSSYASAAKEFIKVFGSLLTFLWFLALPGIYLLIRKGKEVVGAENRNFIGLMFLSSLPLFVWPAITQRIYFIPVAFLVIASLVAFRRLGSRSWYALPLMALYVAVNFAMDSYVLPNISSDRFLNIFF